MVSDHLHNSRNDHSSAGGLAPSAAETMPVAPLIELLSSNAPLIFRPQIEGETKGLQVCRNAPSNIRCHHEQATTNESTTWQSARQGPLPGQLAVIEINVKKINNPAIQAD
eukprot:5396752-Pleurochrysis_carterae.AAC.2